MAQKRRKYRKQRSLKALLFRLIIGIICILTAGTGAWSYSLSGKLLPTRELLTGDASIHFIDVGQGDATLIMTGTNSVLIDTGTNASADSLVTYLETYVGQIDYLILTHPHDDHTGGADEVLDAIPVRNVITPDIPGNDYYRVLEELSDTYDFNLIPAEPGNRYEAGEIYCTILGPVHLDHSNLNDVSIVTKVDIGSVSLLCSGDAEQIAEQDVLANTDPALLDCDIYQVGHHGSSTSTSMEFFYAISPDICVISCGNGNSYGHPHSTVVSLIELSGSDLYRTDLEGTIVLDIKEETTVRRIW
ncbi:MAG: MBL fold metallo-hydrolase [Clostridia bacterium]|nr:MBL fold metallo-hydrolase [Clostridia bacterium]